MVRAVERDRLAYVENKALLHYHPLKKPPPSFGQNGAEQRRRRKAAPYTGRGST